MENNINGVFEIKPVYRVWVCPICGDDVEVIGGKGGSKENPRLVLGEVICGDCRTKIKALIGK